MSNCETPKPAEHLFSRAALALDDLAHGDAGEARTHWDAWGIAAHVRAELDKQSCPDHWMRIAVETVVKQLETLPSRGTPVEDAGTAATLVKSVQRDAQSVFDEYWLSNYRSGCVITDPKWHAPRIFRAAVYAIDSALSAKNAEVPHG